MDINPLSNSDNVANNNAKNINQTTGVSTFKTALQKLGLA